MVAVRAADAGEALVQIAAQEKGRHATLHDRALEAALGRKPLVVDLLEGGEMLVQQPPQIGGLRIAGTVQRQRLDTRLVIAGKVQRASDGVGSESARAGSRGPGGAQGVRVLEDVLRQSRAARGPTSTRGDAAQQRLQQ